MDETNRLKARELLLRSRIYRFVALAFAAVGLVTFLILYFKYVEGDIIHALKNPALVLIVIIPFLPAFIISRMAIRTENKFLKLLEDLGSDDKQKPKN